MAQRGLSAAAIAELGNARVEFYHLVRIDFSTPVFYTTAPYDIDYAGNTYQSLGALLSVPDITESLKIKPGTVSLKMSGALQSMHALLLSESRNANVYIYRYMPSVGEAVLLFRGFTDSYATREETRGGKSTVEISVSNHWSNWDANAGRVLADANQQRLYPGDRGLEFFGVTDDVLTYWGQFTRITSITSGTWSTTVDPGYNGVEGSGFDNDGAPVRSVLPVVYGAAQVSGIPVFRTLTNNNKDLWVVYALSEGECDALVDILFDDVSYTDARYSGKISATFHAGTETQAADSALDAASSLWTSNHRLLGICYVVIKYTYDNNVWAGGEPQPDFVIRGKKVFDPRTSTTAYSKNPALVLYDYLTNSVYGKGLSSSELSGFSSAANLADTVVTDMDGSLGGTPQSIPLFEFSGRLDLNTSIKRNAEAILFAMRAHLPWVSGQYTLVIEQTGESSVYSFSDDNIGGSFSLKDVGAKDLANIVYYSFIDAAAGYVSADAVESSSTYLAEDKNRELRKNYKNRYETNRYRAQNRAATLLKKSRQQMRVQFSATSADAMQVETGNIVDITRTTQGWSSKLFRVVEMKLRANGGIDFSLEEYESTVYDWNVSAETDPPANTQLTDPFVVAAPANIAVTAGDADAVVSDDGTTVHRLNVTWTATTDELARGYQVQYRESSDLDWEDAAVLSDRSQQQVYITGVTVGATYVVRIRAYNDIGVYSSWLTSTDTKVGGSRVIGESTSFDGSDDYVTRTFFYNANMESLEGLLTFSGSESVGDNDGGILIPGDASGLSGVLKLYTNTTRIFSFTQNVKFRSSLLCSGFSSFGVGDENQLYITDRRIAYPLVYDYIIGFKFRYNLSTSKVQVYAFVQDAVPSNQTEYNMVEVNEGEIFEVSAELDNVNNVARFYVNGVNYINITTNLPNNPIGNGGFQHVLHNRLLTTSTVPSVRLHEHRLVIGYDR